MLCFPVFVCPSASCLLHVRTAYEPRIDVTTLHRALCLPAMPLRIRWGEGESSVRNDGAQGVATQGLRPTRFGEGESSVRYDDAQGVATQGLSPTRFGAGHCQGTACGGVAYCTEHLFVCLECGCFPYCLVCVTRSHGCRRPPRPPPPPSSASGPYWCRLRRGACQRREGCGT